MSEHEFCVLFQNTKQMYIIQSRLLRGEPEAHMTENISFVFSLAHWLMQLKQTAWNLNGAGDHGNWMKIQRTNYL